MFRIIILVLFINASLVAQNGFEYFSGDSYKQASLTATELENGNFILCNAITLDNVGTIRFERLNSDGSFLSFFDFGIENTNLTVREVFNSDNGYLVLAYGQELLQSTIIMIKLSNDFEVLNYEVFPIPFGNKSISSMGFNKTSLNDIVFGGVLKEDGENNYLFAGKILIDQELISYTTKEDANEYFVQSIIENETGNGFILFGNNRFHYLDFELNFISSSYIDIDLFFHLRQTGYFKRIDEDKVIISGRYSKSPNRGIATGICDDNLIFSDYDTLEIHQNSFEQNVPAFYKSLVVAPDNNTYYLGGFTNITPFQEPPYVDTTEWVLAKYNIEPFERLWKKTYGGDARYYMYGVLYTSDGGCLMYGDRYVEGNDYLEAYALKVDENGIITGETAIPMPSPEVKIFPNPFLENIRVEIDAYQGIIMAIYDVLGNEVYKVELQSAHVDINLSNLVDGTYTYVLLRGTMPIMTGKLLKQ